MKKKTRDVASAIADFQLDAAESESDLGPLRKKRASHRTLRSLIAATKKLTWLGHSTLAISVSCGMSSMFGGWMAKCYLAMSGENHSPQKKRYCVLLCCPIIVF